MFSSQCFSLMKDDLFYFIFFIFVFWYNDPWNWRQRHRYPYATSVLPSNPALSLSFWCWEKKANVLGRSVHQFFATASELRTLETLESHVTPLDTVSLKGYLEMNSGLENTWPRLETCLTSRTIGGTGSPTIFYPNILTQYPFNPSRREEDVARHWVYFSLRGRINLISSPFWIIK